MAKEWASIRMSQALVNSCRLFLKTEKAKKLGLETIKDVVEYFTRKGIEKNLKI